MTTHDLLDTNSKQLSNCVFNDVGGSQFNNALNLDLNSIIQEIKESVNVIRDEKRSTREKEDHAKLCVYRALSLHPALNWMKPPTQVLGDLDWYTELRKPLLPFSGLFKKLGENIHFKRTSNLGEQGQRARIILLLCWVIGHRLPKDKVRQLVSTAVDDGFAAMQTGEHVDSLLQLHFVRGVLDQLANMIKTRLPLSKERNPFYGEDFVAEDEDKAIPRAELWAYREALGEGLLPHERYEFDVKHNPSVLLRPLAGRVLVPQTKLSLLMIQWVTRNFGLGTKVFCRNDIDTNVFWNADPPREESLLLLKHASTPADFAAYVDSVIPGVHSDGDDVSMASDETDSPPTLFDAFQELPLQEWVHLRFCRTYSVHGWAHDRLIRSLLFSSFCHQQSLPLPQDVLTAIHVAKRLRVKLTSDIWSLIEPFLLVEGMQLWENLAGQDEWTFEFGAMGRGGRGMMLIFADAASESRLINPKSIFVSEPPAFHTVFSFLTNPAIHCPAELDIIDTVSVERGLSVVFDFPELDPATCICGKCVRLHLHLQEILDDFQVQYLSLMAGSESRGSCDALERAWDPLMTKAEQWMDTFIDRIECVFDLFPFVSERRLGIAIMDVSFKLHLKIGAHLDTSQLLLFVSYLRFCHVSQDSFITPPATMSDTSNDFAFITPADPDDRDSVDVLSTAGGWLYDIAGGGLDDQDATIFFIPNSDTFKIRYLSTCIPDIQPVRMPRMESRALVIFPPEHAMLDAPEVPPPHLSISHDDQAEPITVDLSEDSTHGFPILANSDSHDSPGYSTQNKTYGGYGAQISTSFCSRIIRTWWKPQVEVGRPCPHASAYGRMTRCSLTSKQVLLQIRPSAIDPLTARWAEVQSGFGQQAEGIETLAIFFQHQKDITALLTERQGPFERGRLCIVRCGNEEGPVDPLIILAASLGLKTYILHFRECWNCACLRMVERRCALGVVTATKVVTKCAHCVVADRRAERILVELGQ